MTNILIPMAGSGTRFVNAGYKEPKPLIPFLNKTMIEHVVDSLNIDGQYIFVVQEEHVKRYKIDSVLKKLVPNCKILPINQPTSGAAVTTLLAKELIDNKDNLIIANSDQIINWDSNKMLDQLKENDGSILIFKDSDTKWSFAKIQNDYVTEVAEKKPISDNATVGVYGWKHGSDYVKYAKQMVDKNIRTNNEFYVCPVYNEAIKDNKKIKTLLVDKMSGVGTPEDLEKFLND
jgi:dTDP-glucose pyrophosphorylase